MSSVNEGTGRGGVEVTLGVNSMSSVNEGTGRGGVEVTPGADSGSSPNVGTGRGGVEVVPGFTVSPNVVICKGGMRVSSDISSSYRRECVRGEAMRPEGLRREWAKVLASIAGVGTGSFGPSNFILS